MASLVISPPESQLRTDRDVRLAQLQPIPHSPESMDGILYFDEFVTVHLPSLVKGLS